MRIHTLPESKRYPENELEYQEILSRHNTILCEITDHSGDIVVILPEYSEARDPTNPVKVLNEMFPASKYWRSIAQHEQCDEDEYYWHLHVVSIPYSGSELNSLLRLVVNDEIRNIMVVALSSEVVYHPYDGGADIVMHSTERRDEIKQNHANWLSKHPDGY